METACNYLTGGQMYFSSDERKWITKIRRLARQHPDSVQILSEPETNGGCIYASMPTDWLKIAPPIRRNYSEETMNRLKHAFTSTN